ncbi:hypothetical protein N7463_010142 [Penicillium fimorum]|uniref:Uncharacterized protein n=1 Tax=Penicillium fimorum TaxID=1882269 RepID=A0A9W9XK20_9EURO|nr:hypothetical protein N7463_010142 [Penicillium fimorum]
MLYISEKCAGGLSGPHVIVPRASTPTGPSGVPVSQPRAPPNIWAMLTLYFPRTLTFASALHIPLKHTPRLNSVVIALDQTILSTTLPRIASDFDTGSYVGKADAR